MKPLALRERAGLAVSAPARERLYYGWVLVLALGMTETVSYGILSYAFPVFIGPMSGELGWSRTEITGAFSLASLIGGAVAFPVGRWVDRHGARGVMTAGSVLATLLLLAWSRVESLWAFYVIWMGLGVAAAAVFYEPAFAVLTTWFVRLRGRALTVLTFLGGFASVIFVPLATGLVETYGWRAALVGLALILGVLTIPAHGLLLRRAPSELGLRPDGGEGVCSAGEGNILPAERSVTLRATMRSRSFPWLALAFSLASVATSGLTVHLIPLLLESGFSPSFAGAAMGSVGLMALPGRLIFTPLGSRWPRPAVTALIFALQALGIAALVGIGGAPGVWSFAILFGAGFGAITPARAALLAEFYGPEHYGRIGGVLALFLSVSKAVAPVGASLLYVLGGGYDTVLAVFLVLSLGAGLAVLLAGVQRD